MLETIYTYSLEETKIIERLIDDANLNINHMVLPPGERLPEHSTNSNVYMIIVRGSLTLQLAEQEDHVYGKGQIVNIPYGIRMNARNLGDETLEFFVVKAPNPKDYVQS